MIVNFRTHEISRDTQKLARTPTLIKKNKQYSPLDHKPLIYFI
jgi:hypothetical protein